MTHVEELRKSLTIEAVKKEIDECYKLGIDEYLLDSRFSLKEATGEGTKAAKTYYLLKHGEYLPMKAIGRMAQIRVGKTQENYNSITFASALEKHGFKIYRNPFVKLGNNAKLKERAERERTYYQSLSRPEQAKFRRQVLGLFGEKCLLTSCEVVEAIEAAHLIPVSENGSDDVSNGIPLRRDVHRLFDYHLIAIKPNKHTVHLDQSISKEYRKQITKKVAIPDCINIENALKDRWKVFKNK